MESKFSSKPNLGKQNKVASHLHPPIISTDFTGIDESRGTDSYSPESILNLQRTIGNQATLKLLNRKMIFADKSQLASQSDTLLQRLPTAVAIQGAVDKDIKKQAAKDKKAKKTKSTDKEEDSAKADENQSFFDFVAESVTDLVNTVVETVGKIIDEVVFANLLTKLNDFHTYDAHFKSLDPAYADHMARLQHIKDVELASTSFLTTHKEGDPGYQRISKLKTESIDAYIKASPNADRAKQTRKELLKKQNADTNTPPRITAQLIETMVMSVASPMNENDEKGSGGILGIQSAVDAADAIMMLGQTDYDKIIAILANSGDNFGEVAKQATLIKALAARKVDLLVAGPQTEKALKELAEFSAEIKDMDKDEMVTKTHASDRGDGKGLQQRYTMSCGPTSIMIVIAEFDPIYALKLSKEGKHGLAYDGDIAKTQQGLLEATNGANTAVPREVADDWKKTVNAVNTFMATATANQQANLAQYFSRKLAGIAFSSSKAAAGKALAKTIVTGIDIDTREAEWKKYYASLDNPPGWGNSTFASNAKAQLGADTKRDFSETAVKYKSKMISGKTELRGKISKHLKPLNEALFRGKSVPLGVMWAGGGGHFMVFTDMRTEQKGAKKVHHYLVSDPWEGTSGWMSREDLIKGNFSKIGHSQGAIDSIYL